MRRWSQWQTVWRWRLEHPAPTRRLPLMTDVVDLLWEFLNSQFARTVIASLAGAGLGAFTAQRIAAKNKEHDDRVKEVRGANAAATIAYGMTEIFLGLKQQIAKPLLDLFLSERAKFISANEN